MLPSWSPVAMIGLPPSSPVATAETQIFAPWCFGRNVAPTCRPVVRSTTITPCVPAAATTGLPPSWASAEWKRLSSKPVSRPFIGRAFTSPITGPGSNGV